MKWNHCLEENLKCCQLLTSSILVMVVTLLKSFEAIDYVLLKFCWKSFLLWNRWIWKKNFLLCFLIIFFYKSKICYLYPLRLLGWNISLRLLILTAATTGKSNLHLNEKFTKLSFKSQDAPDRFPMDISSSICKMDM